MAVQLGAAQSSHNIVLNVSVSTGRHMCDVVLDTGELELLSPCPSVEGSLSGGQSKQNKYEASEVQKAIWVEAQARVKSWVSREECLCRIRSIMRHLEEHGGGEPKEDLVRGQSPRLVRRKHVFEGCLNIFWIELMEDTTSLHTEKGFNSIITDGPVISRLYLVFGFLLSPLRWLGHLLPPCGQMTYLYKGGKGDWQ